MHIFTILFWSCRLWLVIKWY